MADSERWLRVREALEDLLEAAPDVRRERLESVDPDLRDEVEELLALEGAHPEFLRPPESAPMPGLGGPADGTRLDGFRIERLLASGGMGSVFLATQDSPRRPVALKVLRASLATPQLERRFAYEAQILARLQHPAIAHVYGSGTWNEGGHQLPWFAMEVIDGARSLTEYALDEELDLDARLLLLVEACDAVAHAHSNGVVHRDLKPSNLLVDARGTLKVIDFGCAQLVQAEDTRTLTRTGEILGTLAYLAPEQVDEGAHGVDARSDVYSLGVVLFELLTDRLPVDVNGPLPQVLARIRASSIGRPSELRAGLADELDWVVLRALERDPARRYPTVSELAADLRRFLRHEPVLARRPSRSYLVRKFVRRHRVLTGAAAALFLALVGWGASASVLYMRVSHAQTETARRKDYLELSQAFFDEAIVSVDPKRQGSSALMVDVLRDASERLFEEDYPAPVAFSLHSSMGTAFFGLGEFESALEHLERARYLESETHDLERADVLELELSLAYTYRELQRYEEATEVARASYEGRRDLLGAHARETLHAAQILAETHCDRGAWEEAEELVDRVLSVAEREHGPGSEWALDLQAVRARLAEAAGDLQGAEDVARLVAEGVEALRGARHPETIEALSKLAQILSVRERFQEAHDLMARCLDMRREVFGPNHPLTLREASALGVTLADVGRPAEAQAMLEETLASVQTHLEPDAEILWSTRGNLAVVLSKRGDHDGAEEQYGLLLEHVAEQQGERSFDYLIYANNYARSLERASRPEEAVYLYDEIGALLTELLPPEHPVAVTLTVNRGRNLVTLGRFADAEAPLLAAHGAFVESDGAGSARVAKVSQLLVRVYEELGREAAAAKYRGEDGE